MRRLLILIGLVVAPHVAVAQPTETVPNVCVPACRSGFVCNQGTCISACNPTCAEDQVCTPNGECVSRCNPACAPNEVCLGDGQCRSRCNPPCGPGQQCTAAGACLGVLSTPIVGQRSAGWASGAAKLGIVSAVLVGGLSIGVVAAGDNQDVGLPLGIVATVIGGVTIPIVASGGASARTSPGVIGSPGLRLAGWILYGAALTDAVVLIGLAFADAGLPAQVGGSVGALGVTSAVFMSLDASASASQARTPIGAQPYIGKLRDSTNHDVPMFGLACGF